MEETEERTSESCLLPPPVPAIDLLLLRNTKMNEANWRELEEQQPRAW